VQIGLAAVAWRIPAFGERGLQERARQKNRCHSERRVDGFSRLGVKNLEATRGPLLMARVVACDADPSLRPKSGLRSG
jgi:hypothetical protein